ncbi:hypothetical protein Hypma_007044 [Hypsizygus marmoreus]|uniref:Uncharacterized protein n=1 Tax=Hypsizygus marmoreus TaxID=39966 RepID=A0A369KCE7_HYPMA|nr:hypothetical protein Hypma_007044 [Hypsizygus marmoreus]
MGVAACPNMDAHLVLYHPPVRNFSRDGQHKTPTARTGHRYSRLG